MSRAIPILATLAALVLAPQPGSCSDMPFVTDLGTGEVALVLYRATVEVELVPECRPALSAGLEGIDGLTDPQLTIEDAAGAVRVIREPAAEGEQPPLLLVSLTLDPAQRLRVEGEGLRITVVGRPVQDEEGSEPDESSPKRRESRDRESKAAEADGAAGVQLLLESSQVELRHTGTASVQGTNTGVTAVGCRGPMTIDLQYGFAEVSGHEGAVNLLGERNEYRLRDHSGRVTARLEGGSLSAREGSGTFNANLKEAGVLLEAWEGPGSVTGNYSSVEIQDSGGGQLVITGQTLDVRLERWSGPVVARLQGGSLRGGAWEGEAKLTADDATLDLDELSGEVSVTLLNRARARLARVSGALTVKETDRSELEVDGVETLSVDAADSFVWVRDVGKLKKITLSQCEAELDLTGLDSRSPSISLKGSTTAEVVLKSPCMVRLSGAGARMATGVTLSGCELFSAQHRKTRRRRVSLDGRRAMTLTAKLDEEASLRVRGQH